MQEEMMIAVTGAAGFIGSHLCDALIERGYRVVGIDNLSMGSRENLLHLADHPRFQFCQDDVRDIAALRAACADAQAIVHLAAYKIPRYGNTLDTLLINQEGTKHVLDVARETKCKVVVASTSDVYGKSPQLPFQEDGDLLIGPSTIPRWSYAVSKLYDEHLCLAYQEAYGFPVTLLRFFGSYGPRHHLSWWGGPQSVFISRILRDEEIEIHGDGQQTRSFTYISDTVSGIVAALESPEARGEIFNLGSTFEINILDLAHLIKRLLDTPGPLRYKLLPYNDISKGKYEDVMRRIPNIDKARSLLGFVPRVGLEEGLRRTIAWQRSVEQ